MTIPTITSAMLDLIREHAAAELRMLPVLAVGDRVRVIGDSRAGPKAPHRGEVGLIVAVYLKREAQLVYGNCIARVYLLDFGPDPTHTRPDDRDTWAYADGDVRPADTPYSGQKRR